MRTSVPPVVLCLVSLCLTATTLVTAHSAQASGPRTGAVLVVLGDSYSSGEGLGPYEPGTAVASGAKQNTCHRSRSGAYADLAPAIVMPTVTSRGFWACSGAKVIDVENAPGSNGASKQYGQMQQTSAVGPATQYIAITVGGDDVHFSEIGKACAEVEVHGHVYRISKVSCATEVADSVSSLPALSLTLRDLYVTLLDRSSPSSELVVAGYPQVMPSSFAGLGKVNGKPYCTMDHLVGVGTVGMPVSDARLVATFEQKLNAAIRNAVAAAAKTHPGRVKYSDLYPTSVPRSCKGYTRNATVAGLELSPTLRGIGPHHALSSATFHPTKAGQVVYARAIQDTFRAFAVERRTISFVDAPGTGAPPATLGGFHMSPVPTESSTEGSTVTGLVGPTGTVRFSAAALAEDIGSGWRTWSHGYQGRVYWFGSQNGGGATAMTIRLPAKTSAFYFYAEPDTFATFDFTASANNGTSSGDQTVYGDSGASYFGFYAHPGTYITTITISSPNDFAIGELAIASS